jgi:hypothetical protein
MARIYQRKRPGVHRSSSHFAPLREPVGREVTKRRVCDAGSSPVCWPIGVLIAEIAQRPAGLVPVAAAPDLRPTPCGCSGKLFSRCRDRWSYSWQRLRSPNWTFASLVEGQTHPCFEISDVGCPRNIELFGEGFVRVLHYRELPGSGGHGGQTNGQDETLKFRLPP